MGELIALVALGLVALVGTVAATWALLLVVKMLVSIKAAEHGLQVPSVLPTPKASGKTEVYIPSDEEAAMVEEMRSGDFTDDELMEMVKAAARERG